MNVTIRRQTPDDYPVLADIFNASLPDYPTTTEQIRRYDEVRDPKCFHERLIAECDSQPVGAVTFGNTEWMFHPRRFAIEVHVLPAHRNAGVGTQLYGAMEANLATLEPEVLRSLAREDMPESIHFLEKRGFHEEDRNWESRLAVAAFNPGPYDGIEDCLRTIGVDIVTFGSLASDPDRDRKMFELETELVHDLPAPEPLTDLSYEQYGKHILDSPNLLPEGWMVATHNGEYIGVSVVWLAPGQAYLNTGLTAVKREWRRNRIALAMKLRVIEYARQRGIPQIRTDNESNNVGMLSINERLGFVKQPVWIGYVNKLR
ncbi:MAG TPA: GNAT family N-acetyltransferase [Armatimonadota bacterium]|jgi:GNAT superfamily N-acetyltransferase